MSSSHKHIIEQFTQFINARHVNHLDNVLVDDVEKKENSKIAFKNLQEAREYYSMEHEANPSAQWEIVNIQQDDQNNNTVKATIAYNNHIYNTTYTFNSNGKIQTIDSHLQQKQE